ncbi:4dadea4c-6e56-455e-b989-cac76d900c1f [Thermothielavioides terrestris]|uniref:4dadea4c-6e56-455e-b989-cac76d900c1f n=1 Tax=Thermothielavioides terrestris TaxID=2587410 RepID=A0A3S5CXR7_9PEZI|nr:4dadea4c-6e56-455e-b989-cac76d900c1f [Thermothielavioides terrestris]
MALESSLKAAESLLGGPLLSWLGCWDSRLAFAAAAAVLPLALTYLLTWLRSAWIKNVRGKGDPPPVPYSVPFLGNTFQFAYDTEGFVARTLRRFGSVPFRLNVGFEDMYYIPPGGPVQAMFKNARDLSMKPIIIVAMRDQFGMAPADLAIYERDGSGDSAKPLDGWENMDPAHRVFYHQHRDLNAMLNGAPLDGMMARFIANYTARLRATPLVSDEWTELPDLYAFLRDEMFHAACTALAGERFFELCPDFCRDFWEFDSHVLRYLRRTRRWMAPKAYAVRDRVLASIEKWHRHAREQLDYSDPSLADVDYEPVWGARLMRMRAEMFDKAGFSLAGCASMDLGFLWAANANVIPSTVWVLLNVLLSQNLTERVMAEMAECFDDESGDSFSLSALCGKPLLNGLYLEALRFCVATTSARNPVVDDFKLCGWNMPRNSLMLSISWFGAHDPYFWNTGRVLPNGKPEHPVNTYWAERFLEYPGDPASGPVRKPDEAIYRSGPKTSERTAQEDKTAKPISQTGALQGYFYPYGGGSRICPGRHLAKQEMLVAVAVMMREFEIELLDPASARKARPDAKAFASGAIAPDRKLPVRVRRRRRS